MRNLTKEEKIKLNLKSAQQNNLPPTEISDGSLMIKNPHKLPKTIPGKKNLLFKKILRAKIFSTHYDPNRTLEQLLCEIPRRESDAKQNPKEENCDDVIATSYSLKFENKLEE